MQIHSSFILFLLISCSQQDKHARRPQQQQQQQQQGDLHCGTQNLKLTLSRQTVNLMWEDDPSCFAAKDSLVYELLVVNGNQQLHHDNVTVTTDPIGSSHFWKWTSHMALDCYSSLWLRLRVHDTNITSSWKQERIVTGNENSRFPEVYPRDLSFEVGSRFTFCCVLPAGQTFEHMRVSGYNMSEVNVTREAHQIFSLSLVLNRASEYSCTDVTCQSTDPQHKSRENGACALIGYRPTVTDLQCETRDLESVVCHWNVSANKHVMGTTSYKLNGSVCARGSEGTCRQRGGVSSGETTWTLVAQNRVGSVELWDTADLRRRIHMLSPATVSVVDTTHTDVTVRWGWGFHGYHRLDVTCQVNVSHDGWYHTTEAHGVGLTSTRVSGLIPNWTYDVTLRCATTQHFWKWSEWSNTSSFHTLGDVPDKLDVWMKLKEDKVLIIWKVPLANQSHGDIIDYTVTWSKVTATQRRHHRRTTNNHVTLSVDTTQQYIVTVTAWNLNGSSSPSVIITPPSGRSNSNRPNSSQIIGDGANSFTLSWRSSRAASCGYVVDWSPASDSLMVDWIKLPVHQTSVAVVSKNLRRGQRYSFSVSACTPEAPLLLETRDGYVGEERIKDALFKTPRWKQRDSEVEVNWDPIPLTEQTAFIRGYALYWSDGDDDVVQSVRTDDPAATSLTASDLMISSYVFTLKAQTHLGECGSTSFSVTLNSPTDRLILTVVISLVAVFAFLLIVIVLCYRNWSSIRDKVYPQIPKPVLSDTWLHSVGGVRRLHLIQGHSEADVVEVPQLLRKPGAEVKGHAKNFVLSQSLARYHDRTTSTTSPPRGHLLNPTYDPMMQSQGHVTASERQTPDDAGGYQRHTETHSLTFDPSDQEAEGHMACDFTYVSLPQ